MKPSQFVNIWLTKVVSKTKLASCHITKTLKTTYHNSEFMNLYYTVENGIAIKSDNELWLLCEMFWAPSSSKITWDLSEAFEKALRASQRFQDAANRLFLKWLF